MEMNKKLKCTFRFILSRLFDRERWVVITLFLSFVIVLISNYTEALWYKDLLCATVDYFQNNESLINALVLSYISGVIVYFLTVILPETRRSKPILIEIEEILRSLVDTFKEFQMEKLSVGNWCESDKAIQEAIDVVKKNGEISDSGYNLNFCASVLKQLSTDIYELTDKALTFSTVLTQRELEVLVELRHRNITQRLKNGDGINNFTKVSQVMAHLHNLT